MTESHDTGLLPSGLDAERPALVETRWGTLALYRVGERWVAADAWCPHMLGPLHEGTRHGDEIVCPWHQWRFDLASGARTDAASTTDHAESEGDPCRIAVHATRLGDRGQLVIEPPGAQP